MSDPLERARVFGGEWGAGLDQIEAWLLGYEKALPKHKRKAARGAMSKQFWPCNFCERW